MKVMLKFKEIYLYGVAQYNIIHTFEHKSNDDLTRTM